MNRISRYSSLRVSHIETPHESKKKDVVMKIISAALFIFLLSANVLTFAQTVRISDGIVDLERKTISLKKENSHLEQKVYTQDSISNLQELADQLGFTKTAEPIFLDTNEVALVP